MSDPRRLPELIAQAIVEHGGDLGGWTRLDPDGDARQLFDGRVTLHAEVRDREPSASAAVIHAHVLTQLHGYDAEVLDACVFGIAPDRPAAPGQAAVPRVTGVAGAIRSFLDDKPACTACRAGAVGGDIAEGSAEGDFGLPGLRAFVGPSIGRDVEDDRVAAALDGTKP